MIGAWRRSDSALAWGARGRWFKSSRPDKIQADFLERKSACNLLKMSKPDLLLKIAVQELLYLLAVELACNVGLKELTHYWISTRM